MGIIRCRGVSGMKEGIMETETAHRHDARAIEWHVRLRDGDDRAWEAFADWLAEDPRHAAAYDAIERVDAAIAPLLSEVSFAPAERTAANDDAVMPAPDRRVRGWLIAGGALAASVAAAIVVAPQFESGRYDVATGPGERRTIALDATTVVALNGSTRMTFDRKNARFASLVGGEALFRVRHDDAAPFTLHVGRNRVEDVGTVFNVVNDAGGVRVTVAEGEVVYNPGDRGISLHAGQGLIDPSSSKTVRVITTPVSSVGGWQKGQLLYGGAPLSSVAADLARALGVRIDMAPAIANRPFSGAIRLDGSGPGQLERLAPALGVTVQRGSAGWIMKPGDGAAR